VAGPRGPAARDAARRARPDDRGDSLATIVGDVGGASHLSWIVTAYLLASTASTPLWGKLGDIYGREQFFQAAIAIFLVGSALAGLGNSIGELIAFRALQGSAVAD
jgi:MFS family permease